jgi:hypothetical protein
MSVLEAKHNIFREMMEHAYRQELVRVREHNYSFDSTFVITQMQLCKNPQRDRPTASLKAQVYAKSIAQNFKIKHVRNLIGRLG